MKIAAAYGDVICGRAGRLGLPYELICRYSKGHASSCLLDSPLMQHFSNARGYVFDWGWIVERSSMVDTEDGIQPLVSFGVIPLDLLQRMPLDAVRRRWNTVLDPRKPENWYALPEEIQQCFHYYFNDFEIVKGQQFEIFAIASQGYGCVDETRQWLASTFFPTIVPAFIQWVNGGDERPSAFFTSVARLTALIRFKGQRTN